MPSGGWPAAGPSSVVSGTNGKTTTTSLLRAALATRGPVVTNLLGANLPPGLAAALAAAPRTPRTAVLEVDEAWLGRVVEATDPSVAVLLNLSRDQLDRNNEVRRLCVGLALDLRRPSRRPTWSPTPTTRWSSGPPSAAPAVTWVGAGQPWTADAAGCPNCGGRIGFGDGRLGRARPASLRAPAARRLARGRTRSSPPPGAGSRST